MNVLEKARQRRQDIKVSQASRAKLFKFKEGKTLVSLLPLHQDAEKPADQREFSRDYGMHYLKDAAGKLIVSVGDASLTYNQDCPVREGLVDMISYANKVGDDDLAKQAKDSLARKNVLMGVYVHKTPEGKEEGAQLVSISESLFDQFLAIIEEYAAEDMDVLMQWDERLTFTVERTGTTATDTRYSVIPAAKRFSVSPTVMERAINLDEYIKGQFDESIQKALNFIGSVTGKSLAGSSAGAALTGGAGKSAPALEGPKESKPYDPAEDPDFAPAKAVVDERKAPPAALDKAKIEDAEFEEAAPWEEASASSDEDEDLLAQISALAA